MERRGKAWFTLSKVVIDDYGPKIGAYGLAVYACLVRICDEDEENRRFNTEDVAAMLGLKTADITMALDKLIKAGVLSYGVAPNADGILTSHYNLVDLVPQYYGVPLAAPEPAAAIQPLPVKPAKASPVCKGFVYVIEGEGYFKIGCTTNFSQRLKALDVKAPFAMVVHLVIPSLDIYATERELHRRFAKKHRRGEWFNLDLKDIEEIRGEYQVLDPAFLAVE